MATDPYHAVQQEIQTSLQTAGQLRASYVRIKNMAREDSEELGWARSELKATLAALEADLEDLEDSVKIVETTGPRMFGLEESEVQERKRYVAYVRKEVESMRAELNTERSGTSQNLSSYSASSQSHSGQNTPRLESERGLDGDHQEAWAREEQQLMIREQDRTMESIAGTLSTLAQQAGLMGQEIGEHNEMLDDLESGVDRTDNKLSDAMRKMRKFARKSEERGSGCDFDMRTAEGVLTFNFPSTSSIFSADEDYVKEHVNVNLSLGMSSFTITVRDLLILHKS